MACKGCGKRQVSRKITKTDVMGGYKYLTARQIKARLEVYKRRYCSDCDKRYECDYEMYVKCKKNK
jgi:hypothetical protein